MMLASIIEWRRPGSRLLPGLAFLASLCLAVSLPANASNHTDGSAHIARDLVEGELYEDELPEFQQFHEQLTPGEASVFARAVALLDEGQRGIFALFLTRAQTGTANEFLAMLASYDEDEFAEVVSNLGQREYDDWERITALLAVEDQADVRMEFLPDSEERCFQGSAQGFRDLHGVDPEPGQVCSAATIEFIEAYYPRIRQVIRGIELRPGDAPWQAQFSLFDKSTTAYHSDDERELQKQQFGRILHDWEINHTCGAVYIGERFLLTAAHCVDGNLSAERFFEGRRVRLGSNRIDGLHHLVPIRTVILHSDYNAKTLQNDIALIELESEPRFRRLGKVDLPPRKSFRPRPGQLLLSGWGYVRPTVDANRPRGLDRQFQKRAADTLQGGYLKIFNDTVCTNSSVFRKNRIRIFPGQMCAGTRTGVGSCRGDSGGPLVDTKTNTLVGLVSGGKGCGIVNTPSVFVDVAKYIDWIDDAKTLALSTAPKSREVLP